MGSQKDLIVVHLLDSLSPNLHVAEFSVAICRAFSERSPHFLNVTHNLVNVIGKKRTLEFVSEVRRRICDEGHEANTPGGLFLKVGCLFSVLFCVFFSAAHFDSSSFPRPRFVINRFFSSLPPTGRSIASNASVQIAKKSVRCYEARTIFKKSNKKRPSTVSHDSGPTESQERREL